MDLFAADGETWRPGPARDRRPIPVDVESALPGRLSGRRGRTGSGGRTSGTAPTSRKEARRNLPQEPFPAHESPPHPPRSPNCALGYEGAAAPRQRRVRRRRRPRDDSAVDGRAHARGTPLPTSPLKGGGEKTATAPPARRWRCRRAITEFPNAIALRLLSSPLEGGRSQGWQGEERRRRARAYLHFSPAYPGLFRSIPVYPGLSRSIPVYSGPFRFIPVRSGLFRSIPAGSGRGRAETDAFRRTPREGRRAVDGVHAPVDSIRSPPGQPRSSRAPG